MARAVFLAFFCACACGNLLHAQSAQSVPPPPAAGDDSEIIYQEPPEEDEAYKEKEYFFNPLQSKKEMDAGNYYFKKGNYTAAKNRYLEATLWDEYSPEPFYKLGEAYEKLRDYAPAREAWAKFIALSDDQGKIKDARETMAKWPETYTAPSTQRQTNLPDPDELAERLKKAYEDRQ